MKRKIAYMMSRFPKVSETFILYEILELQKLGAHVEIFPLLKQDEEVTHPEAQAMMDRVHYHAMFSSEVLWAQLYWLARRPIAYLLAWLSVIFGNLTSPQFLVRAIATMPLAALFARKMQEMNIQHIHAHWATHPALAAYVIGRLTGIPYSITAHAHDIYVDRTMLKQKISRSRFTVTISDYNKQLLRENYGDAVARKIKVVHCGIDSDIFKPRVEADSDKPFTMICVARMDEMKGHAFLVDACARLKAQGASFRCILVGDGPTRPQVEAQIYRLGLSENFEVLGQQPRPRVVQLLEEADVMVLPSVVANCGKMEGIPVALMEALAMEIPVVASAISGIPELIVDEETGLLVPERNAEALAAALLRLQEEPELGRQLSLKGRDKVLREFNLKRNAQTLLDLFAQEGNLLPAPVVQPAPAASLEFELALSDGK